MPCLAAIALAVMQRQPTRCSQSVQFLLAGNAGVTPDEAPKDQAANLVSSITLFPTGVWGVNRAQEDACTWCSGG